MLILLGLGGRGWVGYIAISIVSHILHRVQQLLNVEFLYGLGDRGWVGYLAISIVPHTLLKYAPSFEY